DSLALSKLSLRSSVYIGSDEIRYDISDLLDTAYQTYWVWRIESFTMVYWDTLIRRIVHIGYGVSGFMGGVLALWVRRIAENVLLMVFDQSIIYGISVDVDTTYSSKSGNGLEFFKVFRYGVCF
nr:hypothetical protein [Tanacetum cinerariifolium]